jgi:hypothetical protein
MEADELEHGGPSLLLLAIIAGALFAGGLAATMTALMTSPLGVAGETMGALPEQAAAMRLSALLQLGGAIVLGIFTAAGVSRLRFLGLDMAPVQIAFFGGIAAAIFALLSALIQWVLTMPGITMDLGVIRLFQLLVLAVGGVGHVAAMGLLLAGISLAGGLAGLLPRWLMWFGLALAVLSELATLTLLLPGAGYLFPIARFGTLIWMIAIGACLPKSLTESDRARHASQEEPILARAHPS